MDERGGIPSAALPPLLLVHGWGFDASVWEPLRACLGAWPVEAADAGYFGRPRAPRPPVAYVAVGHSLGAMRCLSESAPGCLGLVLVNGFSRFSAGEDFPHGVPARVIDRMLARLAVDPDAVVAEFRRRCGVDAAAAPVADPAALRADLLRLRDGDARGALAAARVPIHVLAGAADPIVPPALTRAAFAGTAASVRWCADGGHVLPLTHAAWCARSLCDVLAAPPRGAVE